MKFDSACKDNRERAGVREVRRQDTDPARQRQRDGHEDHRRGRPVKASSTISEMGVVSDNILHVGIKICSGGKTQNEGSRGRASLPEKSTGTDLEKVCVALDKAIVDWEVIRMLGEASGRHSKRGTV